jgi:lysophospholipase L1-like esterase
MQLSSVTARQRALSTGARARLPAILGIVAASLVLAEVMLQVASLVVHDRETAWHAGSARRVLCVGDSHTFGTLVSAENAYPGRLQRILDARAPGVYSVINKGVPGFSSTQVRSRLPTFVGRLHPDLVIIWCGVNDSWNRLEPSSSASWRERLQGLAMRSRLYRLLVVTLHDRSLERDTEVANRPDARPKLVGPEIPSPDMQQTVMWGDVVEHLQHSGAPDREAAEIQAVAGADYEAMVAFARGAGLPIVFIAYPTELSMSAAVNRALRDVTTRLDVPLVETGPSVMRVPPEKRTFLWALHPNAPMYEEIAHDVAKIVMRVVPP